MRKWLVTLCLFKPKLAIGDIALAECPSILKFYYVNTGILCGITFQLQVWTSTSQDLSPLPHGFSPIFCVLPPTAQTYLSVPLHSWHTAENRLLRRHSFRELTLLDAPSRQTAISTSFLRKVGKVGSCFIRSEIVFCFNLKRLNCLLFIKFRKMTQTLLA